MTRMTFFLAAGAAGLAAAVPAAAQTSYPNPYPQQTYPQPGYPYPQQGNVIGQMIDQLLGNRYAANDRLAVERCATAAVAQANAQYRPNPYGEAYGYRNQGEDVRGEDYDDPNRGEDYRNDDPNRGYADPNRRYNRMRTVRVTAITEVLRRQGGVRVSGLLDSRGAWQPYGNAYGYQGQGYQGQGYEGQGYQGQGYQDPRYAAQGDLTFRCNVDYRGTVTNVRVRRNTAWRGY